MTKDTYREYVYPVIILTLICVVTTALLAVTNYFSAPVIVFNQEQSAKQTRMELLPAADDFQDVTQESGSLKQGEKAGIVSIYKAKNGEGFVYTVKTTSFGGELTMMVGIAKDGKVTGVKVTEHSDTPGVGTKNFDPDYLKNYAGMDSLAGGNVKKEQGFDYITGASVTGTAIHDGVYQALEQFKEAAGK